MKKIRVLICLAFSLIALCSCATGAVIVTGKTRPPIDPEKVQVLAEYPTKYEIIGIVTASSGSGWDTTGDYEYAKEELKKQAAKIGANAVVIETIGKETVYFPDSYTASSEHSLTGKALLIP